MNNIDLLKAYQKYKYPNLINQDEKKDEDDKLEFYLQTKNQRKISSIWIINIVENFCKILYNITLRFINPLNSFFFLKLLTNSKI